MLYKTIFLTVSWKKGHKEHYTRDNIRQFSPKRMQLRNFFRNKFSGFSLQFSVVIRFVFHVGSFCASKINWDFPLLFVFQFNFQCTGIRMLNQALIEIVIHVIAARLHNQLPSLFATVRCRDVVLQIGSLAVITSKRKREKKKPRWGDKSNQVTDHKKNVQNVCGRHSKCHMKWKEKNLPQIWNEPQ